MPNAKMSNAKLKPNILIIKLKSNILSNAKMSKRKNSIKSKKKKKETFVLRASNLKQLANSQPAAKRQRKEIVGCFSTNSRKTEIQRNHAVLLNQQLKSKEMKGTKTAKGTRKIKKMAGDQRDGRLRCLRWGEEREIEAKHV